MERGGGSITSPAVPVERVFSLTPLHYTIMDKMICVVDPISGNDSTGVASATQLTADANPVQTIQGAMTKIAAQNNTSFSLNRIDGGEVQLKEGTYSWVGGGSQASVNGYLTICSHGSTNRAGVIFDNFVTNRAHKKFQRFYNVTFSRNDNIFIIFSGGAESVLLMELVDFSDSYSGWYSGNPNSNIEFLDCTYNNGGFSNYGNDRMCRLHRNCTYTAVSNTTGVATGNASCVLGFKGSGGSGSMWFPLASAGTDNFIVAYSKHLSNTSNGLVNVSYGLTNTVFSCNLIERITSSATPLCEISASNGQTISNLLFIHNTFAGQRFNHENDITAPYINGTFIDYIGKYNSFNARGDHRADIRAEDSTMVGTWSVGYSVGWIGNHNEAITYSGDTDFWGLNSNISTGTPVNAGYIYDASRSGTDEGDGDYTPAEDSALLSRVSVGEAVIPYDLEGNEIPNDGTGDAGAIQRFTPP